MPTADHPPERPDERLTAHPTLNADRICRSCIHLRRMRLAGCAAWALLTPTAGHFVAVLQNLHSVQFDQFDQIAGLSAMVRRNVLEVSIFSESSENSGALFFSLIVTIFTDYHAPLDFRGFFFH